jgi:hypothetical protein
MRKLGIAS